MKNKSESNLTVFVVEDEPDIQELIAFHLGKNGFHVERFAKAEYLFSRLKQKTPCLILLDLMLPDTDGLEVCKILKKDGKYSHIPVIMVTARSEEVDVILGLELGADDYIAKPFSPRELVARVRAVLRRARQKAGITAEDEDQSIPIRVGEIMTIDTKKFEVLVADQPVNLTTTEFTILKILANKPGWVFTREKILDLLWGDQKDVFDRTVDVHIKNLRDKLGPAGKLIKNIRGVGYKLET